MASIKYALAGAAMVLSGQVAEADGNLGFTEVRPERAFVDFETGTVLYDIRTTPFGAENMYLAERARVDLSAGLICQWRATAIVKADENGLLSVSNNRTSDYSCDKFEGVPTAWRSVQPTPINPLLFTKSSVKQDPYNPEKITERFESINRKTGISSRMERVWDVADSTVCLTSSEGHMNERFKYEPFSVIEWGCYETESPYLKGLMDKFGMTGPI